MKLINEFDRGVLIEGRTYELGFGFVKKEKDQYKTLMPISTCKDYLNDFVFGEKFEIPETPVKYGFKHKYIGIFKRSKRAYMLVSMLDYLNCSWSKFNEYNELLNNNYKNIQYYINSVEDKLGIDTKTTLTKIGDNQYVAKFSLKWVSEVYLISLYSLLFRYGLHCNSKISFDELKEEHIDPNNDILFEFNNLKERVTKLAENGIKSDGYNKDTYIGTVHNNGFLTMEL